MAYGVFPLAPALSWPLKEPHSFLDFNYDASGINRFSGSASTRTVTGPPDIDFATDNIITVSVTAAPSGDGELGISSVEFGGAIVKIWLVDGIPGRSYVIAIRATTASGLEFEWPVNVTINPVTAKYPLPAPPSTGPGEPVVQHAATPLAINLSLPFSSSTASAVS